MKIRLEIEEVRRFKRILVLKIPKFKKFTVFDFLGLLSATTAEGGASKGF